MNQRIQDLKEQSLLWAVETLDPDALNDNEWGVAIDEKFAELIVQECIGCCEQVISDPVPESVDTWLNGGTPCMAEIKQQFGVEE